VRARVATMREAIAHLETDTLTRERIAREKLGLVAPGEVLILLSDDPRAKAAPRRPVGVPGASGP
jgi:cell division protein FtsB